MIIALANQKGGVAKTTSVFNIGVELASRGNKVLMVDFDAQASLTICAGLEPYDYEKNIVSVIRDGLSVNECTVPIKDNLYILTSDIGLAAQEMALVVRTMRELVLQKALNAVRKEYDYILIDCPPQLSILTINALSASDRLIIPCKTDYLSYILENAVYNWCHLLLRRHSKIEEGPPILHFIVIEVDSTFQGPFAPY